MGGVDWTQVSIGVACVAMLGYVLVKIIPAVVPSKQDEAVAESLIQVVENNTRAIEQLSTAFQVNFARQEAKIDEVVAYVRRCGQ